MGCHRRKRSLIHVGRRRASCRTETRPRPKSASCVRPRRPFGDDRAEICRISITGLKRRRPPWDGPMGRETGKPKHRQQPVRRRARSHGRRRRSPANRRRNGQPPTLPHTVHSASHQHFRVSHQSLMMSEVTAPRSPLHEAEVATGIITGRTLASVASPGWPSGYDSIRRPSASPSPLRRRPLQSARLLPLPRSALQVDVDTSGRGAALFRAVRLSWSYEQLY